MLLYCLMKKPRGGVEPPACVNETQMPPWQKLSLAQFLLRKFLGGTGQQALQYSRYPRQGKKCGFFPFIRGETKVVSGMRSLFAGKCCNEVLKVGQAVSALTF